MEEAAHLRSVMDMRRRLTGGTQCIAASAPLPFNTRQDPATAALLLAGHGRLGPPCYSRLLAPGVHAYQALHINILTYQAFRITIRV